MHAHRVYEAKPLNSIWSASVIEQCEYVYGNRYQAHNDDRERYCKKSIPKMAHVLICNLIFE